MGLYYATKPTLMGYMDNGYFTAYQLGKAIHTTPFKVQGKFEAWCLKQYRHAPNAVTENDLEDPTANRQFEQEIAIRDYRRTVRKRCRSKARAEMRAQGLQRGPCEVCGCDAEFHHPFYWLPYHVICLCRHHHTRLHRFLEDNSTWPIAYLINHFLITSGVPTGRAKAVSEAGSALVSKSGLTRPLSGDGTRASTETTCDDTWPNEGSARAQTIHK